MKVFKTPPRHLNNGPRTPTFATPLRHLDNKKGLRFFQTSLNVDRSTGTADRKKMKTFESFETSRIIYQSTRRINQENLNLVLSLSANIPVFLDVPRFAQSICYRRFGTCFSRSSSRARCYSWSLTLEDEGHKLFRNVGKHFRRDAASYSGNTGMELNL